MDNPEKLATLGTQDDEKCTSLFIVLSFFFWPLYWLCFNLRLLIVRLVCSNYSFHQMCIIIDIIIR